MRMSGQFQAPATLPVPTELEGELVQESVWMFQEKEKSPPLPGVKPKFLRC